MTTYSLDQILAMFKISPKVAEMIKAIFENTPGVMEDLCLVTRSNGGWITKPHTDEKAYQLFVKKVITGLDGESLFTSSDDRAAIIGALSGIMEILGARVGWYNSWNSSIAVIVKTGSDIHNKFELFVSEQQLPPK